VRAIAIDVKRETTALITFSSPYHPELRAIVLVFDMEEVALFSKFMR
jgi:hypothetical protein